LNPDTCTECAEGYELTDWFHEFPFTCIPIEESKDDEESPNANNTKPNNTLDSSNTTEPNEELKPNNTIPIKRRNNDDTFEEVTPIPVGTITTVAAIGGVVAIGAIAGAGTATTVGSTASGIVLSGASSEGANSAVTSSGSGGLGGGTVNQTPDSLFQSADKECSKDSSNIVVVSYILLVSYYTLLCRAFMFHCTLLLIVSLMAITLQIGLNFHFIFKSMEQVNDEAKSTIYGRYESKFNIWILMFSTVGTYQTIRLFFGNFISKRLFPMSDECSTEIRYPLNIYSLIQVAIVHLPIIGCTLYEFFTLKGTTRLYLSTIDSCVISLVISYMLIKESLTDQAQVIIIKLKLVDRARALALRMLGRIRQSDEERKQAAPRKSPIEKAKSTSLAAQESTIREEVKSAMHTEQILIEEDKEEPITADKLFKEQNKETSYNLAEDINEPKKRVALKKKSRDDKYKDKD
jgi:hypothetical protein